MTESSIKTQIKAIQKVTAEIIKSRESAQKFLHDAGIIKNITPEKKMVIKSK